MSNPVLETSTAGPLFISQKCRSFQVQLSRSTAGVETAGENTCRVQWYLHLQIRLPQYRLCQRGVMGGQVCYQDPKGNVKLSRKGAKRKTLSEEQEEEEAAKRKEKNRLAARRSRAKKAQCLADLQIDVAALQQANSLLRTRIEDVAHQAIAAQKRYEQLKDQVEELRAGWAPEDHRLIDQVLSQVTSPYQSSKGEETGVTLPAISHPEATVEPQPSMSVSDASPAATAANSLPPGFTERLKSEDTFCSARADHHQQVLQFVNNSSAGASFAAMGRQSQPAVRQSHNEGSALVPSPPQLIGCPFFSLQSPSSESLGCILL